MDANSTKKRVYIVFIAITIITIALLSLVAFAYQGKHHKAKSNRSTITGMGEIVSLSKPLAIKTPLDGKVLKILVKNGQSIKPGDGLFVIETSKIKTASGMIYSQYTSGSGLSSSVLPPPPNEVPSSLPTISVASLPDIAGSSGPSISNGKKHSDALKTLSMKEKAFKASEETLQKYKELFSQGGLSESEMKNFEKQYAKTKDDYEEAKQEAASIKTATNKPKIKHTYSRPRQIYSGYAMPRVIRKRTTIKANNHGIVEIPDTTKEGNIVAKDDLIINLKPINPILAANVKVKGKNLSSIHLQQKVGMKVKTIKCNDLYGIIQAINPIDFDKSGNTQTYLIKIKPNKLVLKASPKDTPHKLVPGMKVTADFGYATIK